MLRAIAILALLGAVPAAGASPPITKPSPPVMPPCDAAEFQERGREHLALGMYAAALAKFETALRCNANPATFADAATAACMLFRVTKSPVIHDKARRYIEHLPPSKQGHTYLRCISPLFDPIVD